MGSLPFINVGIDFTEKSVYEKNLESKNNLIEEFKKSKVAKEIEEAFPDAKLTDLIKVED